MPIALELDLGAVRQELNRKSFLPSSEFFKSAREIFGASEHGYRRIDDFTLLHVLDFEARRPYSLTMHRADLVCVQIMIGGSYGRSAGGHESWVSPAMLEVSNFPCTTSHADKGARLRGLLIACERTHFIARYALNSDRLQEELQPIFTSAQGAPKSLKLPLHPAVLASSEQVLSCRHQEPLKGIYLGAKVAEILCWVVSQLHCPSQRPGASTGLSRRRSIEVAAEIYRRELDRPPTTTQLAARVGLNRDDLTGGFQEVFGVTPHAFSRQVRMERAQRLLDEGGLSISEIGRRVGYSGYASFTRAYQECFGRAPAKPPIIPDRG